MEKHYIDYFNTIFYQSEDVEQLELYLKNLRKITTDGLKFKSPDLKVKYGWLKNKYNRMIKELGSGTSPLLLNYDVISLYSKLQL